MIGTVLKSTAALTLVLCSSAGPVAAQEQLDRARSMLDRAMTEFEHGRIQESVAAFDDVARLVPAYAPQLWQRGIALYYAGRYRECRAQFESHRAVNPNDVENAAWHFLCTARAESPTKARAALLPVGPDARVPMSQIYELFRGRLTPEEVLAAAGDRTDAQFYAHLYLGLYFEALGNTSGCLQHITAAADERYAAGGYMHTVAKVHLARLGQAGERKSPDSSQDGSTLSSTQRFVVIGGPS